MSNGGGIIIIRNLIETPGLTATERYELEKIAQRYEREHRCEWRDRRCIKKIVNRLLS